MSKFSSDEFLPGTAPRAIDRFASVVAAASPVLGIYSAGLPGFALLDLFVIPLVAIYFIALSGILRSIAFIIFAFLTANMLAVISASQAVAEIHWTPMVVRSGKFLFYLLFVGFLATRIHLQLFLRTLGVLGIITYGGVFLQFLLLSVTGSFFGLWVPLLDLVGNRTQAEVIATQIRMQRPSSIFIEPAHLSYFLTIHFISLMYLGKMRVWIWILFLIVVLIIKSSYGLFLFATVSFFYLFQLLGRNLSKSASALLVSIFVTLFILGSLDFLIGIYAIQRLLEPDSIALTGRTEAGRGLVESLTGAQRIFGLGFGNQDESSYMNFLYTTVYSFGWLGLYFMILLWGSLLLLERGLRFVAILVLLPLSAASPVLYSYYIIPFALLIVSGPKSSYLTRFSRNDASTSIFPKWV